MSLLPATQAPVPLAHSHRAVVHRTEGSTHGPITRLMSPGDLGQALASYNAVLEQESRNRRALEAIEAIHFRREAWQKLFETYEKLMDTAEADAEMADIYARMARINSDVNQILAMPDVVSRLEEFGAEDGGGTPQHFNAFMREERAKWANVIQSRGIKVDT